MPPRNFTAETLIDLAIERGPAMRAAGITHISIDGLSLVLAPPEQPAGDTKVEPTKPEPVDPLADPATYGLSPGAQLPGFGEPQGFDEDE